MKTKTHTLELNEEELLLLNFWISTDVQNQKDNGDEVSLDSLSLGKKLKEKLELISSHRKLEDNFQDAVASGHVSQKKFDEIFGG